MLVILLFCFDTSSFAQENESPTDAIHQQIEEMAEDDIETEDDSYLQQLEYYKRHPLNINQVEPADLKELRILTDLQIQNFLQYRTFLGPLVSLYELQAIPSWDVLTIKKLLPYVVLTDPSNITERLRTRLKNGESNFIMRFSLLQQKSKGFRNQDSATSHYLGSRPAILIRYKYNHKNILQFGVLGDKDPGEQFFKGAQKQGFDFYSAHLFIRKLGIIKSMALGDFTINMGQGLIHWQSLAFKKSANALSVKRQSDVIRPYNSSGEFNFYRGAAFTIHKNKWELSAFFSNRNLSATKTSDSIQQVDEDISSIATSGYHRTATEIASRNSVKAFVLGGNIQYTNLRWHYGINMVQYYFSNPFKPAGEPYDLFGIRGKEWSNFSFDYSYTFRNIHLFGEIGMDKYQHNALITGIIASADRNLDLAVLYRNIDKQYHSISGNAFTENSLPGNEKGMYIGTSIRPLTGWEIDAFIDLFKFPWLRFNTDAPGYGNEYFIQASFSNRRMEFYIRYKKETKLLNEVSNQASSRVEETVRRSLRTQVSYKMNPIVLFRHRVDLLYYGDNRNTKEHGYLIYLDIDYKRPSKQFSWNSRLQYFETDGFDSRLYAFENDVLYSSTIPAFFDQGFRWYLNLRTDVSKLLFARAKFATIQLFMKYSITRYLNVEKIGSGLAEIEGKTRSEYKILLLFSR